MIQINFNYLGAIVEACINPEETIRGTIYPVEMNGNYSFTLFNNEDDEWTILKEDDATIPFVESDLYEKIVKKLKYELMYAA